jgi:hypothetical protein
MTLPLPRIDPSTGEVERGATSTGCAIEWHPGFSVGTHALARAYRGSDYSALAQPLGDVLTPATIGAAARSGRHDLQALKRVWHLLARFGRLG